MQNNKTENSALNSKPFPVVFLVFILVGFSRHLPLSHPELYNFSPVLAMFFVSGIYFRGLISCLIPLLAVLLSDFLISPTYGAQIFEPFMLATFLSYALIFLLGKLWQTHTRIRTLIAGGILSAFIFHLLTCGLAWWTNPFYAKNLSGFVQAQFIGETGYAPAYLFLRNSLLSSVLFSLLLGWLASRLTQGFIAGESRSLLLHGRRYKEQTRN